jgi:hypothetical protein
VYLNIACLEFAAMSWRLLEYVEDSTSLIRLRLKCDGTRAEIRFRLSAKRTSPFKLTGATVQPTTGSRGVCTSCSNAGYTMFRGSVRVLATHSIRQFPLHFPSRAPPCAITFQLESTTEEKLSVSIGYSRVDPRMLLT